MPLQFVKYCSDTLTRKDAEDFTKFLIDKTSEEYPNLVEAWKMLDCSIKHHKSKKIEENVEYLILQKRMITTEMNIINSFRKKDVATFKVLLERYKIMSVDFINEVEDKTDGMVSVSYYPDSPCRSIGEQAYIDMCNEMKQNIDKYSNCLEALIMYKNYIEYL